MTRVPGGSGPAEPLVRSTAELSERHGLELLRFAYLVTGDKHRAEDLLQEVLFALHRRFGDAMTMDNPVAYARRAIVNTNVSWARRSMNTEVATERMPDRVAPADDPAERDLLWQALRRLPERQRTVLVLRFYIDASDADIAELIGVRRSTVRSLASRALEALRADPTLTLDEENAR